MLSIRLLIALILFITTLYTSHIYNAQNFDSNAAANLVNKMFKTSYNNYIEYAFPFDELRPLTCDGKNTYGNYSLTMLDSLDSLFVFGEYRAFENAVGWISNNINFDIDLNVSVFETNIRVLGGLLSAHLLAISLKDQDINYNKTVTNESNSWNISNYNGELLELAEDLANRLLPAFSTRTGIPFGTVNLKYGVPKYETPIVCTSCAGSFLLEFGILSRLTGNRVYENTARNAVFALYDRRSYKGLYGSHIDSQTGQQIQGQASIGNYVDSFLEYCLKSYILLDYDDMFEIFDEFLQNAHNYLRYEDNQQIITDMEASKNILEFDTFAGFWPGLLALYGSVNIAASSLSKITDEIIERYDLPPELYNILNSSIVTGRSGYPLRPEILESLYYLGQVSQSINKEQNLKWKFVGKRMIDSIENRSKTRCGYGALKDVSHKVEANISNAENNIVNLMDSFFLSETLKYAYLLFIKPNIDLQNNSSNKIFSINNWINDQNVIFSTEGHIFSKQQLKKLQKYSDYQDQNDQEELKFSKIVQDCFEKIIKNFANYSFSIKEDTKLLSLNIERLKLELMNFYKHPLNRGLLKKSQLPDFLINIFKDEDKNINLSSIVSRLVFENNQLKSRKFCWPLLTKFDLKIFGLNEQCLLI